MEHLVEMKNMTMKFPGVVALNNVSFDLRPGEVHILLGENGAGKSTLGKMLSGINKPTSGEIILNGKTYDHLTPKDSMENKIAIIYQELSGQRAVDRREPVCRKTAEENGSRNQSSRL